MNDFIAGYDEMLEEYLEPYDPQKFGRYHSLLDEIVYPIEYPRMNYLAYLAYERMKFEKTRTTNKGVYNWWIHFNEFSLFHPHNLQAWAQPLATHN